MVDAVVDTVEVDEKKGARRRVPRRWLAAAIIVLPIAASERWGGPLTIDRVRGGVSSAAEAASDRLGLDNDNQSAPQFELPAATAVVGPADAEDPAADAPQIHLTFDDGPHAVYTPQILDVLADHGATAVFFPVGDQVAGGTAILQRIAAEGHAIGNHTWEHDRLSGISPARFEDVVGRTQVAVAEATGVVPACLRPPWGKIDDRTASLAENAGLRLTMWTIDPRDWDEPGASSIVERVVAAADDGDIVLLHDGGGNQSQTVDALDRMLDELSDRGFRFTAIPGC